MDKAAALDAFLSEWRASGPLTPAVDDLPSGQALLGLPRPEAATTISAALATLAAQPRQEPSRQPNVHGDVAGVADEALGQLIKALLRQRPPVDREAARATLAALVPLVPRAWDSGYGRLEFLFPFASLIKWVAPAVSPRPRGGAAQSPAALAVDSEPGLREAVEALAAALRAEPLRQASASSAAFLESLATLRSLGEITAAGLLLRAEAWEKVQRQLQATLRAAPERCFRQPDRGAVATVLGWVGEARPAPASPPLSPAPPRAAPPESLSGPPLPGKNRRTVGSALQRVELELPRRLTRFRLSQHPNVSGGDRLFVWYPDARMFYVAFQRSPRGDLAFTINLGWSRTGEPYHASLDKDDPDEACQRLAMLRARPDDEWWSLLPPMTLDELDAAWQTLSPDERSSAVFSAFFGQLDVERVTFAQVFEALSSFERSGLEEKLKHLAVDREPEARFEARVRAVVDQALDELERIGMPWLEAAVAR